ncbi:MAG: hypothetical protein U5R06_05805 [candidate division KSB1 bacterium]|nr:hypothetical protein [candidate division KSB1 bacterium]
MQTLIKRDLQAGYYDYTWDASYHSSGIYFIKLQTRDEQQTLKCSLLK